MSGPANSAIELYIHRQGRDGLMKICKSNFLKKTKVNHLSYYFIAQYEARAIYDQNTSYI